MMRSFVLAATLAIGAFAAPAVAADLVFVNPVSSADYYPSRALREGVSGKTYISCRLPESGKLDNCVVSSETPEGYGFGDAGIRVATASPVDIDASDLHSFINKQFVFWVEFVLPADPLPSAPPSDPVVADADGETPAPPQGEYEDSADGRQFVEEVELTAEDRAARQVHSSDNDATACPARAACETQN